ncbi:MULTISPECIES: hypothetical protein [unclassified Microbacterium]|uniref:hypothetical protein n=1 Tax=unclassified Microbacterium TaxID=2609290 RepID=UPI00214B3742|nr:MULTISPECIES: hypothetical protein [unclassified Microbacterium]MCR2783894.1 hypothetical protein [Microbacterium sp. zg.B96]WIM15261.1 hypothetical protein QNO11_12010 [Microbacterium sp. zg-B96]
MTDKRFQAHGPEQMPDRQPVPATADPSADPNLPAGAPSRWLVPAGVLAAVATVLYVIAFQTGQVLLPILGIVWVVALWVTMFLASRGTSGIHRSTRRLATLMIVLAAGAVLIFVGIYLVATLGSTS